jgi:hypothetical protein
MHFIIALAVLAVSLSVGGCSRAYQGVYAKPIPSPPRHATKVKWVKRPPPPARNLPELTKTSSVKPPPVLTPAAKHYVVRNTVGNCAVIILSAHLKLAPGNIWARPGDDLEIIGDKGGYASSESANKALKDAPCSNPPSAKTAASGR